MKNTLAALVGGVLLIVGAALLVLPGPGFLLIFAGLAVLSTRFEWARKHVDYAKGKAQQGVDEVANSTWRAVFALLAAVALVIAGILDLSGIHIPFVNTASAVLLIVSGLILVGTVVYARRQGSSGSR